MLKISVTFSGLQIQACCYGISRFLCFCFSNVFALQRIFWPFSLSVSQPFAFTANLFVI